MINNLKKLLISLVSLSLLFCLSCSSKKFNEEKISKPKMVLVKSGKFNIGEGGGGWPWANGPRPIQEITITYDFYISEKPITINQWNQCVKAKQCKPINDPNYYPYSPVRVSWDDTQDYLKWLSKATGVRMRLPSESEWEFAIRGTNPIPAKWFHSKDTVPMMKNNFINDRGIFPRLGQHGEWVQDCWKLSYYELPLDGSARMKGDCNKRVFRNHGKLQYNFRFLTLLNGRSHFYKDMRGSNITFRIVHQRVSNK